MALDSGKVRTGYAKLADQVAGQFAIAIDLLGRIDDEKYSRVEEGGSVGKHIRHNLNFLEVVLAGIASGRIDYAARSRDVRIEAERLFAIEKIKKTVNALQDLSESFDRKVSVVSETDQTIYHSSTISREIEFVLSHTVHHHAIIRRMLKDARSELAADFGVAPSTLEYWRQRQE